MLDGLQVMFASLKEQLSHIDLLIGCDCLLRKLSAKQNNLIPALSELFIKNNAIGFTTFGEQLNGLHINQTFTGIAIGQQAT